MERKSRGGRPATKKPAKGEKVPMSIRLPRVVKLQLQHQIGRNGRSLSHEAEYRIERSFDRQQLYVEVMELRFGRPLAGLILAMGEAMSSALEIIGIYAANSSGLASIYSSGSYSDEQWLQDPHAFDQVTKSAITMLEAFRPAGDVHMSASLAEGRAKSGMLADDLAKFVTAPLIEALKGNVTGENATTRWAEQVQPLLAELPGPAKRK